MLSFRKGLQLPYYVEYEKEQVCVCVYVLEILWQPGVGIQGNIFLVIFFIIFSSFCIFVPHPLAAPASSLFLHLFFIFPSFLGRWGLEAEARLFILFSFFFFSFSSFFLHLRWRSGPKGRGPGGGRWGGEGAGGGAKPRSLFILFSFFLHCIFIFSSFYVHLFFIFSSFVSSFFLNF